MPKVLLSVGQVKKIKLLLEMGNHTHQEIANKYGVSRTQITKIHLGMKDPMNKNGRWGHIEID